MKKILIENKSKYIHKLFKNKFQSELIFNYISLGFLGISGLGLNIIIGLNYEPSVLGVFNQVLTLYVIFSMIGSAGISFSVLRSIPSNVKNQDVLQSIVGSGIAIVSISSLLTTMIFWLSIKPISNFLDSQLILEAMYCISPGLFLFSINKVLLNGVINGLNKMKEYAFFQSLRYICLFLSIIYAYFISLKGSYLTIIFSFTEFILFFILIFFISARIEWWLGKDIYFWIKKHFKFGYKSFIGSILIEFNSKVDILMLGIFLNDKSVGIYSFSAFFAEGFYQILTILQNSYNPILSKQISLGKKIFIRNFLVLNIRKCYVILVPLGISIILFYPLIINLITNNDIYQKSINPFMILISGIIIASGYLPFYNLFSMSNLPWLQSIFMLSIVFTNILANLILIPLFGINGAAIGTTISFVTSIFLFKVFTKKGIGIKI
tara:strand:+ start:227 stop:1534 length:1308 start_codon:yes stop_codon:yes gene_type:complete